MSLLLIRDLAFARLKAGENRKQFGSQVRRQLAIIVFIQLNEQGDLKVWDLPLLKKTRTQRLQLLMVYVRCFINMSTK